MSVALSEPSGAGISYFAPADLEGSIRGGVCSLAECLTVSLFFSPLCHLPVAHLWLLSVGLLRLLLLAEPVEQPLR